MGRHLYPLHGSVTAIRHPRETRGRHAKRTTVKKHPTGVGWTVTYAALDRPSAPVNFHSWAAAVAMADRYERVVSAGRRAPLVGAPLAG